MKFTITIYIDEDDVYIAECPSIPGCVSQGKTEEEAEKNVLEAIKDCLEVRAELGMPLTVTTREVEIERYSDGYVGYPFGLKGVVVGQGDTYEEALADVKSAIRFHIETFDKEVFD